VLTVLACGKYSPSSSKPIGMPPGVYASRRATGYAGSGLKGRVQAFAAQIEVRFEELA